LGTIEEPSKLFFRQFAVFRFLHLLHKTHTFQSHKITTRDNYNSFTSFATMSNQFMNVIYQPEQLTSKPVARSVPLPSLSSGAFVKPTLTSSTKSLNSAVLSTKAPSNEAAWSLKESDIPFVPFSFIMDRNTLKLQLTGQDVLDRVATFMRLKSIATRFNSAEAQVECHTPSALQFIINLWLDDEDNKLLFSVQRMRGCSTEMHRIQAALFDYVQGGATPDASIIDGRLRRSAPREISALIRQQYEEQCSASSESSVEPEKEIDSGLDICFNLLASSCEDQKRLGMESLDL
jgi:uncharacterized protein YceK